MEPAKSNMATNDRTEAAALSPLLTSAATQALRRYADLRPKWRNVYTGLIRLSQTSGGLVRYQPDHLIDLIVRSMEDELAARHRATLEGDGRVHLEDTLQYLLTRYWVLGTHDVLRIAARSHGGKVQPMPPSGSGEGLGSSTNLVSHFNQTWSRPHNRQGACREAPQSFQDRSQFQDT